MIVAGVWTLLVWATRIPLLEPDASLQDWLRIGAGLLAGAAVLVSALRSQPGRLRAWINIGFAFAMIFLWLPSLLSVWATDNSVGFRIVHTVLAGVSMGFGVALAQRAQDVMRRLQSDEDVDDVRREEERQVDGGDSEHGHGA